MPKYSNEDLKKWKATINACISIGKRISIRREGDEWVGLCCFHEEKTPSFKVFKGDDGVWLYHCFGCGADGNVFQFVERHDHVPFTRAVEIVLAEAEGIDPATVVAATDKKKKIVTFKVAEYAQCERALESSAEGKAWIEARGITMETARRFHLGFVQDAIAVCGTDHPWRAKGWVTFPTISPDGKIVQAIKYRSLVAKRSEDGKVSGIVRAQRTATMLYNTGSVRAFEDVFIAEGEPDTLVLAQTGTPAVGLPMAQYKLSAADVENITKADRVFLAGDNDKEGAKKMDALWKELGERTYKIQWPEGIKDANDLLLKAGDDGKFSTMLTGLKREALERGVWQEPKKPDTTKPDATKPSVPPSPCADQTASSLKPKKVKWLWQDRIPMGKITLFAGNPDNGKSLVAIDVAARTSTGSPFPDGVNLIPAADVLMMLGEDDLEDTAVPRLMSAQADLDFIHFLEAITWTNDAGKSEIRLDENMPNLEASLQKYPNAKLLVIDPISNYLGRASMIAEQEVRDKILIPLKRLAEKYKIAIVLVMHLNKKSDLEAISRVGGAMAFVGVARASWLFIRDASSEEGEAKDSFSMARIKNNLTKASAGGTAYHIDSRPVTIPDEGEVFVPYVVWGGVVQKSADDVMAAHHANNHQGAGRPEGSDKKLQHAMHWLQKALASGHILSEKIFEHADEEEGIKEHTLRRAARELKIKPHQIAGVGWVWELPPVNATAASVAAARAQDELTRAEGGSPAEDGAPVVELEREFELK